MEKSNENAKVSLKVQPKRDAKVDFKIQLIIMTIAPVFYWFTTIPAI